MKVKSLGVMTSEKLSAINELVGSRKIVKRKMLEWTTKLLFIDL
jgi:hypothetical protein